MMEIVWQTDTDICIRWQGREIMLATSPRALTLQVHMPSTDWGIVHDWAPEGEPKRVISVIVNAKEVQP